LASAIATVCDTPLNTWKAILATLNPSFTGSLSKNHPGLLKSSGSFLSLNVAEVVAQWNTCCIKQGIVHEIDSIEHFTSCFHIRIK
jgi:hypothetical protein